MLHVRGPFSLTFPGDDWLYEQIFYSKILFDKIFQPRCLLFLTKKYITEQFGRDEKIKQKSNIRMSPASVTGTFYTKNNNGNLKKTIDCK